MDFKVGDRVKILRYGRLCIPTGIIKTIGIWNGMIEVEQPMGNLNWYKPEELELE